MSEEESAATGFVLGWRSSSQYYRTGAIIPALNKAPKVRKEWLKQMKFKSIEEFMEALVNGN